MTNNQIAKNIADAIIEVLKDEQVENDLIPDDIAISVNGKTFMFSVGDDDAPEELESLLEGQEATSATLIFKGGNDEVVIVNIDSAGVTDYTKLE